MSRANEPAYPETAYYDGRPTHMVGGLTIREHFAATALPAIISQDYTQGREYWVKEAARVADALLAELAKPVETPIDERGHPVKP